ncbi:MAG TPA: hypothetical protein VGD17_19965 [Chitinophagaceae bacterium]
MIRFPFKGKGCYANVYTHNNGSKEYHVEIIEAEEHPGLPRKIIVTSVDGNLHLAEPLNLSQTVLHNIVQEIQRKEF